MVGECERVIDSVQPVHSWKCSQMTDGGAGVVLVTDEFLKQHPSVQPIARIAGWGHRTASLGIEQKFEYSADQEYIMPHLKETVDQAFARAGVTLDEIDGLETHDCFSASEYLAIDHIVNGQTVTSVYAHLQAGSIPWKVGDRVRVGDVVGLVGTTGVITGVNLHFELRVDGTAINPVPWMAANGAQ